MNTIQNEKYYLIKELQNLMNNFERVFPVIINSMDEFNITIDRDRYYLSWIAGMNFHKQDFSFVEKFVQDVLFKNLYKTLSFKNLSEKAVMFIYFSLGAIAAINYNSESKEFYKEYLPVISKGAAIIDNVKFDRFQEGRRYWSLQTLIQYFTDKDEKKENHKKGTFQESVLTEEIGSITIN